jgi:hypothetical protein
MKSSKRQAWKWLLSRCFQNRTFAFQQNRTFYLERLVNSTTGLVPGCGGWASTV